MNPKFPTLLSLGLLAAFGVSAAAPASAAPMTLVEVTYTDGEILAGRLSFGLDVLPAAVTASILLEGPTTTAEFGPEDVIAISLDFGDAHFTEADLHPLLIDPEFLTDTGDIGTFTTLSYRLGGAFGLPPLADYDPLLAVAPTAAADPVSSSTSTVDGRLAANSNFELHIFGVDTASGDILHYRYSTSEQFGTQVQAVPEPASLAVWFVGLACGGCWLLRRGRTS
jgi:hypothetical protein